MVKRAPRGMELQHNCSKAINGSESTHQQNRHCAVHSMKATRARFSFVASERAGRSNRSGAAFFGATS